MSDLFYFFSRVKLCGREIWGSPRTRVIMTGSVESEKLTNRQYLGNGAR